MANPLSSQLTLGTLGELLVQLRLLQYDVQAAPPLKDSGNDLIAVRGSQVRTIQVKATKANRPTFPRQKRRYDLLAIVHFEGHDRELLLDGSDIYLIPQSEVARTKRSWHALATFMLTQQRVDFLFS
jgi:hypothetical protein